MTIRIVKGFNIPAPKVRLVRVSIHDPRDLRPHRRHRVNTAWFSSPQTEQR
jgi:hypothetical protein